VSVDCCAMGTMGTKLGGQEGVLVIWQAATGVTNFIPRLGAPIKSITVR